MIYYTNSKETEEDFSMIVGNVIFLRHGQTEYTDCLPDLTEQGKQTCQNAALQIKEDLEGQEKISIISSDKARARGTAAILAEVMGFNPDQIQTEPRISSLELRNPAKVIELFQEIRQQNLSVDRAYLADPRFNDSEIVEPRAEIKKRFYAYLKGLILKLCREKNPNCLIIIASHYEVLYHLVSDAFHPNWENEATLGHGELIKLIIESDKSSQTMLQIAFRGQTKRISFDQLFPESA